LKHLVLLGGGHAHIHVLQDLARLALPGGRVTLVSPFPQLVYSGMVPGLVGGHYALDDCLIPLVRLAASAKVQFVQSQASALDAAARRVTLANGETLSYDVLSLATGPVMDRDAIPGAREHALFVRPMEHFVQLWESLLQLAQTRSLSVVVIGGGAAGVELAMALQYRLGERGRVSLLTGGPPLLEAYTAAVRERATKALKRLAITVLHDRCDEVGASHVKLGSGARLVCDAPLIATGSSAPAWLRGSGLALDEQGFIATTATLQSTSHPEVFAAGDVASRADAPRPKSGVYAVRAGPPLALNLRRFVSGGVLQPHLPQERSLNLLACGARRAIASRGDWSAEGRWVWWWKNWIDRRFVRRFSREA
jgi:pyridine nucleotide-disulfide oxidoreductase family protein